MLCDGFFKYFPQKLKVPGEVKLKMHQWYHKRSPKNKAQGLKLNHTSINTSTPVPNQPALVLIHVLETIIPKFTNYKYTKQGHRHSILRQLLDFLKCLVFFPNRSWAIWNGNLLFKSYINRNEKQVTSFVPTHTRGVLGGLLAIAQCCNYTLSSWNHHLVSLGDLPFLQFFT